MGNAASLGSSQGTLCGCPNDGSQTARLAMSTSRAPAPVFQANPHDLVPVMTLHKLVAVGATEDVHFMLDQGHAGVNQVDRWGRSAMHFAAARGDIAMIQVLLRHGGKFDVMDHEGKTPQMLAAERCDGDVVRYLLLVQRAVQFSGGYTPDHQEKSGPATQMQQQLHYEQMLEQQRQLLERVGGRSTPASSQKSSASTEVDGGAKRLDDDALKAHPAAGSQTPVTAAPVASRTDATFAPDAPPAERAAVSGRSPSADMPPHEAAAWPQNNAQNDQLGREPLHNGATACEGLGGAVKTRNFAALADYTYFPSAMSPGVYERAKRISVYEQYRRVDASIKTPSLARHRELHNQSPARPELPPRPVNDSRIRASVHNVHTDAESGSGRPSHSIPGTRYKGARSMLDVNLGAATGGGTTASGGAGQYQPAVPGRTADSMGTRYYVSSPPCPELDGHAPDGHQNMAHSQVPQAALTSGFSTQARQETIHGGDDGGHGRVLSETDTFVLQSFDGRSSVSKETLVIGIDEATQNYPAEGEITAVL